MPQRRSRLRCRRSPLRNPNRSRTPRLPRTGSPPAPSPVGRPSPGSHPSRRRNHRPSRRRSPTRPSLCHPARPQGHARRDPLRRVDRSRTPTKNRIAATVPGRRPLRKESRSGSQSRCRNRPPPRSPKCRNPQTGARSRRPRPFLHSRSASSSSSGALTEPSLRTGPRRHQPAGSGLPQRCISPARPQRPAAQAPSFQPRGVHSRAARQAPRAAALQTR